MIKLKPTLATVAILTGLAFGACAADEAVPSAATVPPQPTAAAALAVPTSEAQPPNSAALPMPTTAREPAVPTDPQNRPANILTPAMPAGEPVQAPASTATPTGGANAGGPPLPFDTPAPDATPAPEPPTSDAMSIPVGSQVGETPPAFDMERVDGSGIARADLTASGRPVFMHYFATW